MIDASIKIYLDNSYCHSYFKLNDCFACAQTLCLFRLFADIVNVWKNLKRDINIQFSLKPIFGILYLMKLYINIRESVILRVDCFFVNGS